MSSNHTRRSLRRPRSVLVVALVLCARPVLAAEPVLERVMVSTAGIGFFDFRADPDPGGALRLSVPLAQVDDILKSLIVYDGAGTIRAVTLPGATPLADAFRNAPVGEADLESVPALLQGLRGAEVTVSGPATLTGRILNVVREDVLAADGRTLSVRHRVGLVTGAGLRSFILEDVAGLEFTDPALAARLRDLLARLADARSDDERQLTLSLDRGGSEPVRFGYLAEAPVWKASYRVVLGTDDALLQGWAVVENASGQPWRDVELSLVAGSPRALRQALYRSYFVDRPEVPVAVSEALEERAAKSFQPRFARAMPGAADSTAFAAEAAPSQAPAPLVAAVEQELTAQTVYRLPKPVSVEAGQSLMAPLVDRAVPTKRVALVTSEATGPHPQAALRLTNSGEASLPPGLVTIYEGLGGRLSFAGDAPLEALPPGGTREVAYAVDGKVRLARSLAEPRRIASLRAADGVLELTLARQMVTSLELVSEDTAPRQLVIDWARPDGWRVVEPADAALPPGRLKAERALQGGESRTERIVLEQIEQRLFRLDEVSGEEIVAWADGGDLPPPLRQALGRLTELAQAVGDAERGAAQLEGERQRLVDDQGRLRANLESVPGNSDLGRGYLDRLGASEREIERVDAALADARRSREATTAARLAFIRQLRL